MSSTPGNLPGQTPRPEQHSSTGPDVLQVPPAIRASRFPRWALVTAAVLALLLVVCGAVGAAWKLNDKPQVVVTASGMRTPWALVPPLAVGPYSRDANAADTPSAGSTSKKQAIATTYSKAGRASFVLLMSRPETDAKKFMTDMGMNTVLPEGDGWCGTSIDNNRDGCALVRDDTAIMVLDLDGLTRSQLMTQAVAFADTLAA